MENKIYKHRYKIEFIVSPRMCHLPCVIYKIKVSPGQCGLLDWSVLSMLKGCGFDSQSGHIPK